MRAALPDKRSPNAQVKPRRLVQLAALLAKELRDSLRDRRGLSAALVYCVVGPMVVVLTAQLLIRQEVDSPAPRVVLVGAESAPHLRAHLVAEGVTVSDAAASTHVSTSARELLAGDAADVVLRVEADAEEAWSRGRPLELTLYADTALAGVERQVTRLREILEDWDRQAVEARLVARGVAPGSARALRVDLADLSTSTRRGDALASMLLVYLLLAPFFASAALAADLVAGERERATLEQLLVQPAPPLLLVAAKWTAAASLAVAGTAAAVTLGAVVLGRQPLHELGVRLDLGPAVQLRMVLVLLPLALAAAAVQVLVAAGARNYKEAQTYLTLLAFLPAVVAMLAALDPAFAGGPGGSADALPLLGQLAALRAVLSGGSAGAAVLLSSAACLLMVVVCLPVAAGLLRRERGLNTA